MTHPAFRLAAASLSGRSDAEWAGEAAEFVDAAFLGGIALDEPTRQAARDMVDRDRNEFLPPDPFEFIDQQLSALRDVPLRPGFNVRAVEPAAIRKAGAVCRDHDAILEINAHCRQEEMCAAGSGERLLQEPEQLGTQVRAAAAETAPVSVKLRTEIDGVDLPAVAARAVRAGADIVHVDAMDSEPEIAAIVRAVGNAQSETDRDRRPLVVANNGVRDRRTVREYLAYGADAVSLARPTDEPPVLQRVRTAVDQWFESE